MNLYYESINSNSFLVYKLDENEEVDNFTYGMLSNNDIEGILSPSFTQSNLDKFLKYNVSSYITFDKYIEGAVSRKKIINAFLNITSALIDAGEYMIEPSIFVLDPQYIFVDVNSSKINLICVPVMGFIPDTTPLDFFKKVIFNVKYDENDNTNYVANIINYLNSSSNFSLAEFKKLLQKFSFEVDNKQTLSQKTNHQLQKSDKPGVAPSVQSSIPVVGDTQHHNGGHQISQAKPNTVPKQQEKSQEKGSQPAVNSVKNLAPKEKNVQEPQKKMSLFYLLAHYSPENQALYKEQKKQAKTDNKSNNAANVETSSSLPAHIEKGNVNQAQVVSNNPPKPAKTNFGQTVDLNHRKKTTVLSQQAAPQQNKSQKKAVITRNRTEEQIVITHVPFKIGASTDGDVDYVIKDNTSISQNHVIIDYQVSGYIIVDDHSTNGTYVNANRIEAGKFMLLNPGDYIRMADEDFRFGLV